MSKGKVRKKKSARRATMRRRAWSVSEARARLDHLLDEAEAGRPQEIKRRGKTIAVLVLAEGPEEKPETNLLEFFQSSPLAEAIADRSDEEINRIFERDKTPVPPPIKFD